MHKKQFFVELLPNACPKYAQYAHHAEILMSAWGDFAESMSSSAHVCPAKMTMLLEAPMHIVDGNNPAYARQKTFRVSYMYTTNRWLQNVAALHLFLRVSRLLATVARA